MLSIIPFVLSNWRAFAVGAAALFIAGWALHERETLIAKGVADERAAMEKANAAELAKANSAASAVDLCYRTVGHTWDRARGVCVSAAASQPPVRRNH